MEGLPGRRGLSPKRLLNEGELGRSPAYARPAARQFISVQRNQPGPRLRHEVAARNRLHKRTRMTFARVNGSPQRGFRG